MSSKLMRLGALAGTATLLASAIAWAQDRVADRAIADTFVFNPVEGRITVLSSQPDGARVEKGAVVCELDPTGLQDRLGSRRVAVATAEAEFRSATLAREVAELALAEYKEGAFVLELATVEGDVKLAESNVILAEDSLEWSRRMFDKGYLSLAAKVADELKFKKAQFALEQAQSRRQSLITLTKKRRIKELDATVETARARELARQSALEQERSARDRVDGEFQHRKVVAPVGGRVHYPAPMGTGAVLQDGQVIFRIEPDGRPAAAVK
jgi:HlyD family secretion protein